MIGIYQDSFVDYLKNRLGVNPKITSKNIIIPCSWCEFNQPKDHYHMYISLDAPIFHCFHAECEAKGVLGKLLRKIEGKDISDVFVDKNILKELTKKREVFTDKEKHIKIEIPRLDPKRFLMKELYIRNRLKFAPIESMSIKGLVYDIDAFIELNKIQIDEKLFRMKDYLQSSFVGFLTENKSTLICRNIDSKQEFRYYKMKVAENNFLDYYKLKGGNPTSKKIVIAEGIFDIFTTSIFDGLNINNQIRLYASALSSKFESLIKSIVFHEQVFRPEIVILSDRGITKNYYQKLNKYNSHVIEKMEVFYNNNGKDFNDTPLSAYKISIL
jgi:hypothetical protein